MFKVGDIVQVKEEERETIRKTYDSAYWSPKKRKLGMKAANGDLLTITYVNCDCTYIAVTDVEHKSEKELSLESKYFELHEFVQEIDENTMFALL